MAVGAVPSPSGRGRTRPITKEQLVAALEAARARTLALLAPVSDADLKRQFSPLQSPLVWDLAHIGFFEELWLLRRLAGERPAVAGADRLYDAFANPREARTELPLLEPGEARAYVASVRERALAVLERIELDGAEPLLHNGFVYGLVVQHELQHGETILQTLQLSELPYPGPAPAEPVSSGWARMEGGPFVLGAEGEPWAYDNELPAHELELGPFEIATAPVTNREFLAFVEDGGEPPLSWLPNGRRLRFGAVEELPLDEPACHVSWLQAEQFARWAGARLPTEQEWEKAAKAGVLGGIGAVWEWTASAFHAYPGFAAFPYPEYSEAFFGDEYRVLRGASIATDPTLLRPSFRNWDYPQRRQIFSGLRLAR